MTTGNPRDEADLQEFLGRDSALSGAYAAIDPVQPPDILDTKVLNSAKAAVAPAGAKPAAAKPPAAKPAAAKPAAATPAAGRPATEPRPAPKPAATPAPTSGPPAAKGPARPAPSRPAPVAVAHDDDDAPPARRPRWLLPVAAAATVLVAVGIGFAVLDGGSGPGAERSESGTLGSLFAKRARERSEADQAAAASAEAAQEAEVVEPLPPPPIFEPEGPQVEDLDKAIALIRRELVMANQTAAPAEPATDGSAELQKLAVPPAAPAADAAPEAVIQPRERRLTKILELYDGGNPDLAGDSLEIFLRDFEDDPISQRILETQPRATDVAVE